MRVASDRCGAREGEPVKRLALALCLLSNVALAHKPSDSYLRMSEPRLEPDRTIVSLRWDVALRDLDRVVEIDTDRDGKITWRELKVADPSIRALLTDKLHARLAERDCTTRVEPPPRVVHHSDGAYAVYAAAITCPGRAATLELTYDLFFDVDPQHRGLLRVAGGGEELVVYAKQARLHDVTLPTGQVERQGRLVGAIAEGIHHIWTGYDHMLFLVALLLPAVLRRKEDRWVPVAGLGPALLDVLKVVSSFTLAHSITLSLAALGLLALPTRVVESAIAVSVVLAALNNLFPVVRADRWLAAFALGLLHGFGFSSTLADLGLERSALVPTLFGFNIGVEIGQAAVVAAFVPLAYAARRSRFYRVGLLGVGSAFIAVLAAIWLYERATGNLVISG